MSDPRLEQLEIQLAWQADLLESLNQTVADLNREVGDHKQRLTTLQQEIQRLRHTSTPAHTPADEKPPHY
ncbi:MAG: SlyX family protein [Cardiobacteriaceae bacterium]|nr:SlyX family protein [Cardiobacteriaceae bacterium]